MRPKRRMKPFDDICYINKVLEGDTSAFSYLVNEYQDMVYSLSVQLLKSEEAAADLAQEVFIKAYKSLKSYKGTAKFSTWIYRITYNMAISKLRKKRRVDLTDNERQLERAGGFELPVSELEDEQREVKILQGALKKLKKEEQVIITLHYYDSKSIDEISNIIGLSASNVKVKLFRIRKKLKKAMDQENAIYFNSLN